MLWLRVAQIIGSGYVRKGLCNRSLPVFEWREARPHGDSVGLSSGLPDGSRGGKEDLRTGGADGVKWDPHSAGDTREWGILLTRDAEILDVLVACGC